MNNNVDLNVTNIPTELKLILEIIKSENDLSKEWYVDIDWDLFLQLALHHRLYPLLYTKLMKLECSWIPSAYFPVLNQLLSTKYISDASSYVGKWKS